MPVVTRRLLYGAAVILFAALLAWDVWELLLDDSAVSLPRALAGWALLVAGCGALWWRRRWPVLVALFVLLCAASYFPLSGTDLPLLVIAFAVALFTVAAEGHLTAAIVLAGATMLLIVISEQLLLERRHVDNTSIFLLAGWFVGLVAVGQAYSTRLAYLAEVERRALAAEREQEVRARQSATEERLRIARELHDVLGHNVSLINVQSSAALHRHAKRAAHDEAREADGPDEDAGMATAMAAIRDASREALRELRATLGVLRQVEEEPVPTGPAEGGLARIDELVRRAEAAGLRVRTDIELPGDEPAPPSRISLAAYRVLQESLTNVVRHAAATNVEVGVRYERDGRAEAGLRVWVEDDGSGVTEDAASAADASNAGDAGDAGGVEDAVGRTGEPAGHVTHGSGLRGMAERARALGGELTVGNVTDRAGTVRGFRVEAWLPMTGGVR